MNGNWRSDEDGFTLIELLVVMIVIAILAAVAIPVFLNQRDKARDTAVKADVTNVGKFLTSYYVDAASTVTLSGAAGAWSATDAGGSTVATGRLSGDDTATGSGTSDTDWCVAVTSPHTGHTWWYTATAGLVSADPGTC